MDTIKITDFTYQWFADELMSRIGNEDGIRDTIGPCELAGFTGEFCLDAAIYHTIETAPDYTRKVISDVVPVWWEFHTYDENGDEVLNDFRFDELKKYLIEK